MPESRRYFAPSVLLKTKKLLFVNSATLSRVSIVLSSLAILGVIIVLATRPKAMPSKNGTSKTTSTTTVPGSNAAISRIAYVDIDSLEAHYDYFKNKKAEFTRRQEGMESELQRSAAQLQNEVAAYQKKGQNGGFASQAEVEAAGRRLQQMEQSLTTRREALAATLLKDQDAFNKELQKRLDDFLTEYVQDKPFDYVLSYSKSGSILYADKSLDVTQDVIEGMNTRLKDTAAKR